MDFFDRQARAQRNTKLLVFYFVLAVVSIILAIYLAIHLLLPVASAFAHTKGSHRLGLGSAQPLWDPQLFLWVALGTLALILGGSAWRIMELSQGGSVVATMLGGRLLNPMTTDPDERKLLNVVEEMAIASGTPVPQVYLLPNEQAINAFAAGHSTSDMVIAVTRGGVRLLSRDELQGVIGHEFSHILNGDMRLNLRLMGVIFGIMGIAFVGRILLQTRGSSRDRNALPLLGLVLLLLGWIGVLFGRLIQSAVGRQREFLADASSVQFTRNPDGLAGALKKIGGLGAGSQLNAARAAEASHMFFANGLQASFFNLFATHPPLDQRIRAIEPNWDGQFPAVTIPPDEQLESAAAAPSRQRPTVPFPFDVATPQAAASGLVPALIAAAAVVPSLGAAGTRHLRYAADWQAALPPSLDNAAREPLGASALIYALLLSADEAKRRKQLDEFSALMPKGVFDETQRVWPEVSALATRGKLPLVDLALPALRNLSPGQFEQFTTAVRALIDSDQEIDWFEYVLQKIVRRHLEPHFTGARKPVVQYYVIRPLVPDCVFLLSILASVGQEEPAQTEAAFRLGWRQLQAPEFEAKLLSIDDCSQDQLDEALDRLGRASPLIKKNILNACAHTVAADGVIKEEEAELLRAIADTLDCPIPPFVQGV